MLPITKLAFAANSSRGVQRARRARDSICPINTQVFPDLATRPRQREVLIEFYRQGKVDEAVRAFKKTYLEVVHQMIDHL